MDAATKKALDQEKIKDKACQIARHYEWTDIYTVVEALANGEEPEPTFKLKVRTTHYTQSELDFLYEHLEILADMLKTNYMEAVVDDRRSHYAPLKAQQVLKTLEKYDEMKKKAAEVHRKWKEQKNDSSQTTGD